MKKILSLALVSLGGLSLLGGALLLGTEAPTEVLAEGTGTVSYEWEEAIPDDTLYVCIPNGSTWSNQFGWGSSLYVEFWGGTTENRDGVQAVWDETTGYWKIEGYASDSTNLVLEVRANSDQKVWNTWDYYGDNALPPGGYDFLFHTGNNDFNGYSIGRFVCREVIVEADSTPYLYYWTNEKENTSVGPSWPGMMMEAVDSPYVYSVSQGSSGQGYSLYRGVARYYPFGWVTDYGSAWNLIINDNTGNQTANLSHSVMEEAGYLLRFDKTGSPDTFYSFEDSLAKRSAYEFLKDWRTLRKEHQGVGDSICWLLEDEAKLGEVLESYEGASSYLSGVTDVGEVTIGMTVDYLRTLSGGTAPGGEAFRPFSGGKEEGTLYLLGGTLLVGVLAALGYFLYRKKARRGL